MSEMIERVARALAEREGFVWAVLADGGATARRWQRYERTYWRDHAVAAIEAMREPTMTMLNAAVDATGAGSDMSWANRSPQGLFETGHKAAIDAALRGD